MKDTDNKANKHYQALLRNILGADSINIPLNGESNNLIGALAHKGDFEDFKSNFELLLKDLKEKYEIDSIRETLTKIANSKTWMGAYAELVALSVLKNDYSGDILTNVTLKEEMSFAKECKKKFTNEDGYWRDFDVYFDTKILSNPIKAILKGIENRALVKASPTDQCSILAEYPMDDDDAEYSKNIAQIEKELVDALTTKKTFVKISTLKKLSFRLHWGSGINSVTMEYSPFRDVEKSKDLILKRYANKLLKNKPFFLVFVNFPWFHQVVKDFAKMNECYYRALARRTFIQYEHSREKAKNKIEKYTGKESMRLLARRLTGIIFIEDHSINETKDKYHTYVYLNPNAHNKCKSMKLYLEQLANKMYDDFQYDNY